MSKKQDITGSRDFLRWRMNVILFKKKHPGLRKLSGEEFLEYYREGLTEIDIINKLHNEN